jgi:hypothetical protein
MRVQLLLLAALGVPVVAAWGARALVVYAFFALLTLVLVHGAAVAGELIAAVSRSRFDYRDRRR